MDENKKDETTTGVAEVTGENPTDTTTETVPETASEVASTMVSEVAAVADTATAAAPVAAVAKRAFNYKIYIIAVLAILTMVAGLIFLLEKEGRISTGLFAGIIGKMEAAAPAAKVNDVVITKGEFKISLDQLEQMTAAQGADVSSEGVKSQLRQQAIDTLVNAELLRQAALAAGKTVTAEQIETRFGEIRDGLGGAEALASRMAEFGVTEASLRRDIENEFLIQALFDEKVDTTKIEVSDAEINNLYTQAGGAEAGLPPVAEIRDQIVEQIRFNKEQVLINEYITTLKSEAAVEVMI